MTRQLGRTDEPGLYLFAIGRIGTGFPGQESIRVIYMICFCKLRFVSERVLKTCTPG